MIKLCVSSVVKLLSMVFKNCVLLDEFPNIWKKSNNIDPIIRKIINKQKTTIGQFRYCPYVANRLKELFLTLFTIILKRANFLQLANLVFDVTIHV